VVHGNNSDARQTVQLRIIWQPDNLMVEIIDHGAGPEFVPPESVWDTPDAERENGRGLDLMRRLSDGLILDETPGGGLTVCLRFNINNPRSESADTRRPHGAVQMRKGEVMELQVVTSEGVDVIHIAGRLDLVGANALKDEIRRRLQERPPQIVLNLKNVDFINSSGLGALVSVLKDVRLVGGRLILSDLAPYVQEIFTITQLANVFEIYLTEARALETFKKPTPA
jgi:anti-sigma B factor antagonist